ncbi:MAG: FliM/FliN family flagellar motor switch protein [Myxococcota bacterium]
MRPNAPPLLGHLDPAASRMVEELFRAAVGRVRTRLVNRVGTDLPVDSISTEWAPLGQALDGLAPGAAVATFRIEPSGLTGVCAVEGELLTRLVGQILGQQNEGTWTAAADRPLSRFDLVIARRVSEDVLGGIVELFPQEHTVSVLAVGSSARVALGLPRTAFVGSTVYEVEAPGGHRGRIQVVMPSEITRVAAPRPAPRASDPREGLERVLLLPVTVVAELRRISLSLSQLKAVRPGQILDLGPAKDVVVRVGDRPALLGEPGVQNTLRSVRIKGRVEGGMLR